MKKSKMYFEDFKIGLILKTNRKKISKEEIINFAKKYDPQDFHIDEKKASEGPFGKLVSSGFMTLGISCHILSLMSASLTAFTLFILFKMIWISLLMLNT